MKLLAYFPPCPAELDRESRSKQLALLQASGSLESLASEPSQAAAEATQRSLGTTHNPRCYVTSATINSTGYGDATPGYDHRGFLTAGGDIRLRVVDLNRHGNVLQTHRSPSLTTRMGRPGGLETIGGRNLPIRFHLVPTS
jgi:hypothetical protein